MLQGKKPAWTIFSSLMVIAFLAIGFSMAQAEDYTENWVAPFEGPAYSVSNAQTMTTDSAGNVYVAGQNYSYTTNTSGYYTVSYDPFGNQRWTSFYKGPANGGIANAIITDATDNVYVTGTSLGLGTGSDFATVAYDSSGKQLWVSRYNSPENTYYRALKIAIGNGGNIYVTGIAAYGSDYDILTVAYNTSGKQLWVARYDSSNTSYYDQDVPSGITTNNDGNVYVSGSARGPEGTFDYVTIAYDSSGNQLWLARYDGSAHVHDSTSGIVTDSTGNVIVTGYSNGIGLMTTADYTTISYDTLGRPRWVSFYDGQNQYDSANLITTDILDNIYITGFSYNDSGVGFDIVTVAYNSFGSQLWATRSKFSDDIYNAAGAIATDSEGNVFVSGSSYNSSWTQSDIITIAYDSFGNELLRKTYAGPENSIDFLQAMSIDTSDNIYLLSNSRIFGENNTFYNIIKYSKGVQNNPPLPEAGVARTAECSGTYGAAFTLAGSGSSDPDGDQLSYTWTGPFGTKTGEITTVALPLGTHTITLTVDDSKGGTATDTIELTVQDTTSPVVTMATLSGNELLDGLYLSDVIFSMEATDTCSGVANVSFTLDGTQSIVQGNSASVTISSGGDHAITYNALDNTGNVSAGGNLAFSLFEASTSGLIGLVDYFLAQGLIDAQMETSLDQQAANGNYGAFINHVEAQSGKKIDPAAAQALTEAAQAIMEN